MARPTRFIVNVTDQDGTLIGTTYLDGLDLSKRGDRSYLGERVEDLLGGDLIEVCAALPEVDSDGTPVDLDA